MRKKVIELGRKMAKLEGLKKELTCLKDIVETTILLRDREGFEVIKNAHNEVVRQIKELDEEIEREEGEIDEYLKNKYKEEEEIFEISKHLADIVLKSLNLNK